MACTLRVLLISHEPESCFFRVGEEDDSRATPPNSYYQARNCQGDPA